MKLRNSLNQWADAHTFYSLLTQKVSNVNQKIAQAEDKWRRGVVQGSPNGHLMKDNSFFRTLKKEKKIYLFHVTSKLNSVLASKNLYPSGGCLVGSVYCTPITCQNGKLRLHNLGKYILEEEAPRSLKSKESNPKKPDCLIIEVALPNTMGNNLIGIDYLRLGSIHFNIYKELEYLLSSKERYKLRERILTGVKRSLEFLSVCNKYLYSNQKIEATKFFSLLTSTTKVLPVLGYLYFEVLVEYILLYQDNEKAKIYAELGEFYNPTSKNLVFKLFPELLVNFKLSCFKPTLKTIISSLRQSKAFSNLDKDHLESYLVERLAFFVNTKLFGSYVGPINFTKLKWDFETVTRYMKPLIGHFLYRELRNFGRYPDFYYYFGHHQALQVWNYWNHMDIVIPFSGALPKGEIGINPAYPDLKYKIYKGKTYRDSVFTFIEPVKQLEIKLVPRLVDLKYTFMHASKKEG